MYNDGLYGERMYNHKLTVNKPLSLSVVWRGEIDSLVVVERLFELTVEFISSIRKPVFKRLKKFLMLEPVLVKSSQVYLGKAMFFADAVKKKVVLKTKTVAVNLNLSFGWARTMLMKLDLAIKFAVSMGETALILPLIEGATKLYGSLSGKIKSAGELIGRVKRK